MYYRISQGGFLGELETHQGGLSPDPQGNPEDRKAVKK